jgi:hypothetical protein
MAENDTDLHENERVQQWAEIPLSAGSLLAGAASRFPNRRNHHEDVVVDYRGGPKLVCWNLLRAVLE